MPPFHDPRFILSNFKFSFSAPSKNCIRDVLRPCQRNERQNLLDNLTRLHYSNGFLFCSSHADKVYVERLQNALPKVDKPCQRKINQRTILEINCNRFGFE